MDRSSPIDGGRIDLHSHSRASDGQYAPAEVAERVAGAGLAVWALSDHDTVAGVAGAAEVAGRLGVRLVPGIELSAFLDRREIHLLGQYFDWYRVSFVEPQTGKKSQGWVYVTNFIGPRRKSCPESWNYHYEKDGGWSIPGVSSLPFQIEQRQGNVSHPGQRLHLPGHQR